MVSDKDEFYMKKCFELAKKGGLNVLPNPLVGSVIVKNGKIVSKGFHKKYGGFHAEREAILKAADEDLNGADIYINLEPCSHFGKTPPCLDLIIEKKIKRVIFSNFDPNPLVDSVQKLKDNGIVVKSGVLEKEGYELNKVFFKNITKKIPYIMIKTATTLDSKVATVNYNSKGITNELSREYVMKLRSSYQAIMTGSNTVKFDNPRLTSRIEGGVDPVRIIMDRKGRLNLKSNVFKKDGTRIIVIDNSDKKYPPHIEKIPFKNMKTLMKTLYKKGIYSIMVETGGKLTSVLIQNEMADEINHFIAPKILGGGISFVSGLDPVKISDSTEASDMTIQTFGSDILLNYKLLYKKAR